MKTVALEEHYLTPEILATPGWQDPSASVLPPVFESLLCDLSDGRLRAMDEAAIDVEVLSLTAPGLGGLAPEIAVPLARKTNTDLRTKVIDRHPTRFAGFATLPTTDPDAAGKELEWSVTELGLVGALIDGRTDGKFLDDPRFDPILSSAAQLEVPIYLHPNSPTSSIYEDYYAGFSPGVGFALSTAGLGWHQEIALHSLRLVLAGVFDRYPSLKVIVGHMGEGLPFYLGRIGRIFGMAETGLRRPVTDYLLNNFWLTTSGFPDSPLLQLALSTFGEDRIMFSVDYPFSSNLQLRQWFDNEPLSEDIRAKISYQTASTLLKI